MQLRLPSSAVLGRASIPRSAPALWGQTLLSQPSLCPRRSLCCPVRFQDRQRLSCDGSCQSLLSAGAAHGDRGDATGAIVPGCVPLSPHPAFLGFTCSNITGTVVLFLLGFVSVFLFTAPSRHRGCGSGDRLCGRAGREEARPPPRYVAGGAAGAAHLERAPPGRGRGRLLARGSAGGCGEGARVRAVRPARLVRGAGGSLVGHRGRRRARGR